VAHFDYTAYATDGRLVRGQLEAASQTDAHSTLQRQDLLPVEICSADRAQPWWQRDVPIARQQLTNSELARMSGTLATFLTAGLPLPDALTSTSQTLPDARARGLLTRLAEALRGGKRLGEALDAEAKVAPDEFRAYLAMADASDQLAPVLDRLGTLYLQRAEARAKVAAALIYPVILIFAALAMFGIMVFFLAPTLEPIFRSAGAVPNPVLGFLFWTHANSIAIGAAASIVASACLIAGFALTRAPGVQRQLIAQLPLLGRMAVLSEYARLARSLSLMSTAGMSLRVSLRELGGYFTGDVKDRLRAASNSVEAGRAATEGFVGDAVPPVFRQMAEIAHKTNSWEGSLNTAATLLEADLTRLRDRSVQYLTPAITLIVGLLMAVIVLSVVNALLDVNSLILQ